MGYDNELMQIIIKMKKVMTAQFIANRIYFHELSSCQMIKILLEGYEIWFDPYPQTSILFRRLIFIQNDSANNSNMYTL